MGVALVTADGNVAPCTRRPLDERVQPPAAGRNRLAGHDLSVRVGPSGGILHS